MFRLPDPHEKEVLDRIDNTDMSNAREVLKLGRELENDDLWKIFGKETEAGQMLFKLFHKGQAPRINYPKPKVRAKSEFFSPQPKAKTIPKSQTIINYPTVRSKYHTSKLPPIYPVDRIPKRKPEYEIKKEIEDFYSHPPLPNNRGTNRNALIEYTQDKFKRGRGALPKGAELPVISEEILNKKDYDEDELKTRALAKIPQKKLFLTQKPARKSAAEEEEEEYQAKKPNKTKAQEEKELEYLYQQVEQEIEDRQRYLEEIAHLDEPKIKQRIKIEIIERIAELEKIIKLMHKAN